MYSRVNRNFVFHRKIASLRGQALPKEISGIGSRIKVVHEGLMEESTIVALKAFLPSIVVTIIGPIIAHVLYAVFANSKPKLALLLISAVTLIWMTVASSISYGPPFGGHSKTIITAYIFIATAVLWFVHHLLIRRSEFRPSWFYHLPVILLFSSFCLLLYTYHIAPRFVVPI